MTPDKQSTPSTNKNISIAGDVVDSIVINGDNNTVNQTIIQKFFNIFKSNSESMEQRNRRILLGHVENAWIKGVSESSRNNLLPWRLVPFLDHCVDLIFLRRVGGGYIFVHRLLMEHFAEMYVETPTSKGN